MGLQVAAANKIINELAGLAFAGGEFETDNPAIRFVSAEAWTGSAQGAHIVFATAAIGTTSPVEGMRLTSEGILLVGTDTASGSAKLQVSGAISVSGITYAGTLALSATGANPITFSSGGTEGFRLAPTTRNLLIGTTTDDGASKLQVAGALKLATDGTSQIIFQNGSNGQTRQAFLKFNTKTGTAEWYLGNDPNVAGSQLFQLVDGSGTTLWTQYPAGNFELNVGELITQNNKGIILQNAGGGAAASLYRDPSDDVVVRNATSGKAIYFRAGGDNNMASLASTGTFTLYNSTATTGVTSLVVRAGAGQSTSALVNVTANDGTTSIFKVLETKIGFFNAAPVVKQTVTADAASILAALQAYGLAV